MTATVPPPPPRPGRRLVFATAKGGVPLELSVRVMAAMGGPMVLAVMFGRADIGSLASIGTLFAPSITAAWTYPQRGRRLPLLALLMAVAFEAGLLVADHRFLGVAVIGLWAAGASAAAGMFGSWAAPFATITSVSALLGTGIGSGLPGWAFLAVLAGGAWVAVVFCLGWVTDRWRPERRAVAGTYAAVADYLGAIGTPEVDSARLAARRTLLDAWEAVGQRPPTDRDPAARVRLYALLQQGQRLLDSAVSVAFDQEHRVPDDLPMAVRAVGLTVPQPPLALLIGVPRPPADGSRHLRRCYALAEEARQVSADDGPGPGSVPPLLETFSDRLHRMPPVRAVQLRSAARLGIAVAAAAALPVAVGAEHQYWVALTTLLVMRSDPAGTHVRAAQRALGTVLGVGVAGGLLLARPSEQMAALAMGLVGYWLPTATARSYLFAAALRTAYALLLIEAPDPQSFTAHVLVVRLLDTAIGAGIAVAAVLLLWPFAATSRLPHAVAACLSSTAGLLRTAFSPVGASTGEQRALIPGLLSLRSLFDQAMGERRRPWPSTEAYWPVVIFALRLGAPVRLAAEGVGADTSPLLTPAGAGEVAQALEALAGAVESGRPPPDLPWPPGRGGSGLHDVVGELHDAIARAART